MSIRTALIGGMLAVGILAAVLFGIVGVWSINRSVLREAQSRVNSNLTALSYYYDERLDRLAERFIQHAESIDPNQENLNEVLKNIKSDLDFSVLNLCTADGEPLVGSYPDESEHVPVEKDPVLRRVLRGQPRWGTILLEEDRLELEGGAALRNAMVVYQRESDSQPATTSALFWWMAYPVIDSSGRVVAVAYGGRHLNHNYAFVDHLREMGFGADLYEGKPQGTVTIFLGGVRVATNVLGPDRQRAVGTRVSEEVYKQVLGQGENWLARAWVVDAWYLSGYEPLRDPDGKIIGMLYVGLLESPYRELRTAWIMRLLGIVFLVIMIAVISSLWIVNRTVSPLIRLGRAATELAEGRLDHEIELPRTYREITQLAEAFREMEAKIVERDRSLRDQNRQLGDANEQLERANRNYLEMLGFVTHELKSPLASMQTVAGILADSVGDKVDAEEKEMIDLIHQGCEDLQDMVKNYLDLSRVERGELKARVYRIEFYEDVLRPCIEQVRDLYNVRRMKVELICPAEVSIEADPELLRVVVNNYLINAAKYGRENSTVRVEALQEKGQLNASVLNQGVGFTEEEHEHLFGKFVRLNNPHTADARGSGLGLFLCKQIVELHSGYVWAESQPNEWAQFGLCIPLKQEEETANQD